MDVRETKAIVSLLSKMGTNSLKVPKNCMLVKQTKSVYCPNYDCINLWPRFEYDNITLGHATFD
jgi:hypothetical protein